MPLSRVEILHPKPNGSLSRTEIEAILGLSIKQTRVYQEAKAEGQKGRRAERDLSGYTVPLLLQAGLTLEQIADLQVDILLVRQSVRSPHPGNDKPGNNVQ